jgi:hypothetical protein
MLPPMDPIAPMMQSGEVDFLAHRLSQAKRYLEFGAGGSTFLALKLGVPKVYSVESSADWLKEMRYRPEIPAAEQDGRLTFFHADIGPTKELGFPVDDAAAKKWPAYYRDVWPKIEPATIDTVLIDGRFRVACALAAIAHCGTATSIMIHDFWDRPFYHPLLYFTRVVGRVDNIVALEPLPVIDWRSFALAVAQHALDPR